MLALPFLFMAVILLSANMLSGCRSSVSTPTIAAPVTMNIPPAVASGKDSGGIFFTDIAKSSGIDYEWKIAGKRPLTILQTIGNGCAFLDYDNDGNLDILLVGSKLALYKGDGKGRFTDVTKAMGLDKLSGQFLGCSVGDYDNDGYDDLYISGYRTGVLLHNEGGKGFRDVTKAAGIPSQQWGTSSSFVDIDGDGKLDLYIANYVKFSPNTNPQLCPYSGQMSACGPRFYTPEVPRLYHNMGGGKFMDVTGAKGVTATHGRGLGVAAADFDGSGKQSIALANDEIAGDLLHNNGAKFQEIGAASGTAYNNSGEPHGGMGVDWGDYDNDGKLDLAVATFQHEAKCVYHNEGNALFVENSSMLNMRDKTSPYVSFGTKFADFDNDGFLDLIFANGHVQDNIAAIDSTTTYRQSVQVLRNVGGQSFADISAGAGEVFTVPIVGRGLAVGDFDNDGRMDVLVVDSEGHPLLLHNQSAPPANTPPAHWLGIKLVGTKSNRDGYGALLRLTTETGTLLRHCHSDGSYLSASDARVHFGLGQGRAKSLSVRWTSGKTDTYSNLPTDRYITIKEGDHQLK